MSALMATVVSTWMCFGCNVDSTPSGKMAPVNVLVADQKTAAPRISDTSQTARKEKMGSVDRLVKFRILEDANFARRAYILAHRMAQSSDTVGSPPEVVRPATGAAFLDALVLASHQGPIGDLVIFGHAGSSSLYMMEDRGFYRAVSEVAASTLVPNDPGISKEQTLRKSGARDLRDLETLVRSGDIRFATNAVVVFTGCAAAGEKDIDPSGIAARFADITHATVIASLGVTDQSVVGRRGTRPFDEYSRGTWVRFVKGANPQKLETRILDPLRALLSDDGPLPVVDLPIEMSPPMPDFHQYWCAASTNDLACGLRGGRVAANAA